MAPNAVAVYRVCAKVQSKLDGLVMLVPQGQSVKPRVMGIFQSHDEARAFAAILESANRNVPVVFRVERLLVHSSVALLFHLGAAPNDDANADPKPGRLDSPSSGEDGK